MSRAPHRRVAHGIQRALVAAEARVVGLAVVPVPDHRVAEEHVVLARDVGALERRILGHLVGFRVDVDEREHDRFLSY